MDEPTTKVGCELGSNSTAGPEKISLRNECIPFDVVIVRVGKPHGSFFFDGLLRSKGHYVGFAPNIGSVAAGTVNNAFIVNRDTAPFDR